jgi:hypothetical protein
MFKRIMNSKYLLIGLMAVFMSLASCKDKTENCTQWDYERCNTIKPSRYTAKVNLTINSENPSTIVRLYEGNWEDNRLISQDIVKLRQFWYTLDVEKYYSVTATYRKGNTTIVAIDGGEVKVTSYQACELTCYEVKKIEFDLKIE